MRAVIVGSGTEIPANVRHQRHAGPHDGHERRVDPRAERRRDPLLRRSRHRNLGPRGGGGATRPRAGRVDPQDDGPRRLRHHDTRPLLSRVRRACCRQAGPAGRALLRHPPAVRRASSTAFSSPTPRSAPGWPAPSLLVGAEVHIGFMPWTAAQCDYLYGRAIRPPTPEEREWNTPLPPPHGPLRGRGGGGRGARGRGAIGDPRPAPPHRRARTTTSSTSPARASSGAPTSTPSSSAGATTSPSMDGRSSSSMATTRMVEVAQELLARNGVGADDLDLVLMHQANKRINEHCQKALGLPDDRRSSTTSRGTATPRPPRSRCSGTRRAGRPDTPATSCCWWPSARG